MAATSVTRLFVRLIRRSADSAGTTIKEALLAFAEGEVNQTFKGTTIVGTTGNGLSVSLVTNNRLEPADVAMMIEQIISTIEDYGWDDESNKTVEANLLSIWPNQTGEIRTDWSVVRS